MIQQILTLNKDENRIYLTLSAVKYKNEFKHYIFHQMTRPKFNFDRLHYMLLLVFVNPCYKHEVTKGQTKRYEDEHILVFDIISIILFL